MSRLIANPKLFAATGILFVIATVFNIAKSDGFAVHSSAPVILPVSHMTPERAPMPEIPANADAEAQLR